MILCGHELKKRYINVLKFLTLIKSFQVKTTSSFNNFNINNNNNISNNINNKLYNNSNNNNNNNIIINNNSNNNNNNIIINNNSNNNNNNNNIINNINNNNIIYINKNINNNNVKNINNNMETQHERQEMQRKESFKSITECPYIVSLQERSAEKWVRPDKVSKCTYEAGVSKVEDSPHHHKLRPFPPKPKILPNVLEHIGNTPLVKLNRIPKEEGVFCDILAKCEFLNAGGSVKDRIALRMVEDAEKDNKIKPGDTIIEATSGNTGIGLALVSAVKGYRCIIVLPEKMSQEKVDVLRALGAEIVRTPTAAAFDHPESNMRVAAKLNQEIPNSIVLNQYVNPANPIVHYDETAEEIIEACGEKVDMVVVAAGTGGTIAGISRKIKEKLPTCIVVGVDPLGSIIAQPESLNKTDKTFYEVEGIGYDFRPTVLDLQYVDKWYKSDDKPSFNMARRLIKDEGLLCGGSSGSSMYCALQAAKDYKLQEGQKVVVLLADSIRNYMTKHLNDDWMRARSFLDTEDNPSINQGWRKVKVSKVDTAQLNFVSKGMSLGDLVEGMEREMVDFVAVVNNGEIIGTIKSDNKLVTKVMKGESDFPVSSLVNTKYKKITNSDTLGALAQLFDQEGHVVVYDAKKEANKMKSVIGYATPIMLASYVSQYLSNTF